MNYPQENILLFEQARLLISRLERLSANSVRAHRASGVRGALVKSLDRLEHPSGDQDQIETICLQTSLDVGFQLLENAAKELLR